MQFRHDDFIVRRLELQEWERAWPLLQKSLAHTVNRLSTTEMRAALIRDTSQLWIGTTREDHDLAAMLTTVRGETFMFELIGGEGVLDMMGRFIPDIEQYMANHYGCKRSMLIGRPGWVKAMACHGYKSRYVMCDREIPPAGSGEGTSC